MEEHCRICGLYQFGPTRDERGVPTYDICDCCGTEFGYNDENIQAVQAYRTDWIEQGTQWFNRKSKPNDWDLELQMKNIPPEFR